MTPPKTCACAGQLAVLQSSVNELDLALREALSLLRRNACEPPAARPLPTGYARVVTELTAAVVSLVPPDSSVLVVSRGDEHLLDLDGRHAGHFPQSTSGTYAGHHPFDSDSAIAHLDRLRSAGWRYLVFPTTALWWLDHYAGLRRHLETTGRLLLRRDGVGVVYGLSALDAAGSPLPLESAS